MSETARYSSVKPPRLRSVVPNGKDISGRASLCDSCVRVRVRVRFRLRSRPTPSGKVMCGGLGERGEWLLSCA